LQEGFHVLADLGESVDVPSLASGAAASPEVEGVDGVSPGDEPVDHVSVAAAVFAKAVPDDQHRLGLTFWPPALIVKFETSESCERSFGVVHCILLASLAGRFAL